MTCARSYAWFLNCFIKRRTSSVNSDLLKVSKINIKLNCSKSANWTAQSQQNDQFENLYISSHGEARNIKFGQQVNIIERVTLGTPSQEVVMSLAHNHVANLFMSSYRGATVIKFVSRYGTSELGVVTSLPFDHVTLINLYISSHREATGLFQIFWNIFKCFKYFQIKFSKFSEKDKCCGGSWPAFSLLYLYTKHAD